MKDAENYINYQKTTETSDVFFEEPGFENRTTFRKKMLGFSKNSFFI